MGRKGHAWTIASPLLSRDVNEIALEYPVTTEIKLTDPRYNEVLSEFYENCCNRLKEYLGNGEDVVVLCEGDPFFYGSFMHLHSRLANFAANTSGSGYNRYVRSLDCNWAAYYVGR